MAKVEFPELQKMVRETAEKVFRQVAEKHQLELTEAYNSGYNDALKAIEQRVGDPWSLERGEWDEILKELR